MTVYLVEALLAVAFVLAIAQAGRLLWRDHKRVQAARVAFWHAARPENQFCALVKGDSIDAMKAAALERARALYGPDALLVVERVRDVMSLLSGTVTATVEVRNHGPQTPPGARDVSSSGAPPVAGCCRAPGGPSQNRTDERSPA